MNPPDLGKIRQELPRLMLERFSRQKARWDLDGAWEPEYAKWRDFYGYIEEVRGLATSDALHALADRVRDESLLDLPQILAIQPSALKATAEALFLDPRSQEDPATAEQLLTISGTDGWEASWFELLRELTADDADLRAAAEFAARASQEANEGEPHPPVRRTLRKLQSRLESIAQPLPRPLALRVEDLPDLLTAEIIADILGITLAHRLGHDPSSRQERKNGLG